MRRQAATNPVKPQPQARAEALVQRRHPRVTDAGRAHLCVGGQIQATPTPFRTYPAAALWHEADGLHIDQPARILRCLKLATSYTIVGRGVLSWSHIHRYFSFFDKTADAVSYGNRQIGC